jgi:hypothetical protein
LTFYKKALEYTIDVPLIKRLFNKVSDAQAFSLKQKEPNVDKNTIEEATYFKAGISLVFYRNVLDGEPTKEEEEMIYRLGGLMQIENDIFDVYKDSQESISTLATIETKISNLRECYRAMTNEIFDLVRRTQSHPKNKRRFIRYISLVLFPGNVCLDCLERNEKSTNNFFLLNKYKRKDLICDMEKFANMLRVVRYYLRLKI